ncbi:MAG: Uma2 family endonuclease [Thermodesulfobacteriota bacterium]
MDVCGLPAVFGRRNLGNSGRRCLRHERRPRDQTPGYYGKFLYALKSHPGNHCYTGISPMDIVLDAHHVVQPDVLVVCNRSKVTPENIQGAPDLIVEVVSPSTEVKDRREKRRIYEKFFLSPFAHLEWRYAPLRIRIFSNCNAILIQN